ncbi:CcoQ/FixQ family Cbb3-type cytochrome c oxidase assembly chaperone [Salinimicrobium soli]|uniref:CcoQ/FixQ family Cbb3-type cytochrome c oxidase assembly chaperone n=1 Tax=Salinimicrobium soli TaxID=1254399 RepID=UPI003AAEEAA3
MLKFIKGHMETIAGVEIYPIISLSIFFVFFLLLFWWVYTAKKDYIQNMEQLPFEPENDQVL